MKHYSFFSFIFPFMLLNLGCQTSSSIDPSRLKDFHEAYTSSNIERLSDSVDLYIDYSTCLAEAKNSDFYREIQPKIIDCNPVYWSIKRDIIKREQGEIYSLLNNIEEINYADLRTVIEKITASNHQAVLITDCEYFQNNNNKDNFNNPYLAQFLKNWLRRGYEVYIYAEEYMENGEFDKYRYYMFFSDNKLSSNIFHKILEGLSLLNSKYLVKLTNSDFKVETKYEGKMQPKVNEVVALNPDSYSSGEKYEIQEYQADWEDILKYVQNGVDPNTGNPIPGGDYLIRGIFLNQRELKYFKINSVDVKVYNISDGYNSFLNGKKPDKNSKLDNHFPTIDEFLIVDKKLFNTSGEIGLKIHPNFIGVGFNADKENILKIDLIINEAQCRFNENINDFNIFKWQSIGKTGIENQSLFHSVKNTIEDDNLNPKNSGILYSFYIITQPFK